MKTNKAAAFEELQIVTRFEILRQILLSESYSQHLDKPLAYWAQPTDRQRPLAFLGRSLRELLNTPFAELSRTPGVGHKKLASFVHLLARAANTDPAQLPDQILVAQSAEPSGDGQPADGDGFDPTDISEVAWAQWRFSVVRQGLGGETLGRLAPSLQNMTRVIWNRPLSDYIDVTLAEIRGMRTHGEKRVRAILEVFHAVHALAAHIGKQDYLVVRIIPRLIDKVEQWTGQVLQRPGIPAEREIFENFVQPLLEQVHIDTAQQIAALAETRLGIHGPICSVRQVARSMGLTRARVYQLLNEVNDVLTVRWPTGRHQGYELRDKFQAEAAELENPPDLRQFHAAVELFYPGSRRGAAGPIEFAPEISEEAEAELLEVS